MTVSPLVATTTATARYLIGIYVAILCEGQKESYLCNAFKKLSWRVNT